MSKGPQKTSWTWQYFTEISTTEGITKVECSLCKKSLGYSIGNMGRHLKSKHPKTVGERIESEDSVDSDELNAAADAIIDSSASALIEHSTDAPDIKLFNVVEKEGQGYVIEEVVESSRLEENSDDQRNLEKQAHRKTSYVWKYFAVESNKVRAKCLICSKTLSRSINSFSNLARHLRLKHPKIFIKHLQKSNEEELSDNSKNHDANTNVQDELQSTESRNLEKQANRKTSYVWKYFAVESNKVRAKCLICSQSLSRPYTNTSNLTRHIRTKHPKIFMENLLSNEEGLSDDSENHDDNTNVQDRLQSTESRNFRKQADRRTSYIWKYFALESNKVRAKCLICSKTLSKSINSLTNLARHLRLKHPKIFIKHLQKSNEEELSDNSKNHDANTNVQDELQSTESRSSKKQNWKNTYWKYFNAPVGRRTKCKLCLTRLSYPHGSISNLKNHIMSKHPSLLVRDISPPPSDSDNSVHSDMIDLSLHMEVDDGDDYSVAVVGPIHHLAEHYPNARYNLKMGKKITVAACTLNQLALDFEGNLNRILQSITLAKQNFATYRSGPELEIPGYSCEDHFFESDTQLHCWQVLVELLKNPICQGIMIDVGMPVRHRTAVYNCRVVFLDKKIILIRPKLLMCDDGNYRETRWFTPWRKLQEVEDYYLPHIVSKVTGQESVPFGDAVIATSDTCIGFEICEELWNPQSSHIPMSLDGVELILNSSGSYMELRKANIVDDLITSATFKCGGCYVFSNLRGCDGQRTFFNGGSVIAVNGNIVSKAEQFSLKEVEVTCATIDLEDIRSYRSTRRSLCSLSNSSKSYKRVNVKYSLASKVVVASPPIQVKSHSPEEEIAYGPACWLWDYLRRSGQGGFFLPLSGGVDSSSTACIVYAMCHLIYTSDDNQVLADVRKMVGNPNFTPQSPQDICNKLFVTCYIGTENSSLETKERAMNLSRQIGSYHLSFNMDAIVQTMISVFTLITGKTPKFKAHGGTERESLALQNIQARLRMVLSYFFAQLMLWVRGRQGGLLVLGSANVDESLRGYLTKYDCSSADVNPIGGISKKDLKRFLQYMSLNFGLTSLDSILAAPPTAELEPMQDLLVVQTDEVDMGMTYDELNTFGVLRKTHNCGPYSMFCKLVPQWNGDYTPEEVADKVKHFFRSYAINRHKMSVLTPSIHVESYSPDDNRFDHRQFLYNVRWPWQFRAIDNAVKDIERTKGVSV